MDVNKEKDQKQTNMGSEESRREDKIESLRPDHDVHNDSCGCDQSQKKDKGSCDR